MSEAETSVADVIRDYRAGVSNRDPYVDLGILVDRVAEIDHIIGWDTMCASCARLLDKSYEDYVRLDKLRWRLVQACDAADARGALISAPLIRGILDRDD